MNAGRFSGPSCRLHAGVIAVSLAALFGLPDAWGAAQEGFSVLVIGDSNTEHGFITINLADTLHKYLGAASMGSGYLPLDSECYALRAKRHAGITVAYDTAAWKSHDMYEYYRRPLPFLSPSGMWLECSVVNAPATVTFPGNGVDLYWLADTAGGTFTITIDDTLRATVATSGERTVSKTTVAGLASAIHTMRCAVTSVPAGGRVTLLGFDARNDQGGSLKRSVVHTWGNGWCSSQEFVDIDSAVFVSGLRALAPDVIVVLLGTNDHFIASRSAGDFKNNLIGIVNRIKASGVDAHLLLVSTFMTNHVSASTFLPQYRATSWPEAAARTDAQYWDMCDWFGAWNKELMTDDHHCNEAGGRKIACEMLSQIMQRFCGVTAYRLGDRGRRSDEAPFTRFEGGWLTVDAGAGAPCNVAVYSVKGTRVAGFSRTGPSRFPIFNDAIPAAPGEYLCTVRTGGKYSVLLVPNTR